MIDDLVREYLSYLRVERGCSPRTVEAYAHDLALYGRYLAQLGVERIAEVDRAQLAGFEGHLFESGLAPSSIKRRMSSVRGFTATSRARAIRGATRPMPW